MLLTFALLCFLCALLPAGLFFANLQIFHPPAPPTAPPPAVSVLIPARNEEANLEAALASLQASVGVEFEGVVLDDASVDRTAEIAEEWARRDGRFRLARAPALPPGWKGKQHACHCLAQEARHEVLLFLDADVRLSPDALARLVPLLQETDLLSGVPRQITGTFSEKLLIPLIHFVLLGFLPLQRMRTSREPALGAGCGQLFLTTAAAYRTAGGHAAIPGSIHDGLHLPRLYRQAGLCTDLADFTPLAHCRMYHTQGDTWRGLVKNAHEGMGARRVIVPMTLLLLFGQVAPWALLLAGLFHPWPWTIWLLSAAGAALSWGVRGVAAVRFQQPPLSAALHPLGILGMLGLQWWARVGHDLGRGSTWKGRLYHAE